MQTLVPLVLALAWLPALACGDAAPEATSGTPSAPEAAPPADAVALAQRVLALEARSESQEGAVADAERALEEARVALEAARQELEATRNELTQARAELAVAAPPAPARSDAELFRVVQLALLEAEALSQVAISVDVSAGEVLLRGRVPDEATRDAALRIAREAAAPATVLPEIEVAE